MSMHHMHCADMCERDIAVTGPADLRLSTVAQDSRERDNRISPVAFQLITTDFGSE